MRWLSRTILLGLCLAAASHGPTGSAASLEQTFATPPESAGENPADLQPGQGTTQPPTGPASVPGAPSGIGPNTGQQRQPSPARPGAGTGTAQPGAPVRPAPRAPAVQPIQPRSTTAPATTGPAAPTTPGAFPSQLSVLGEAARSELAASAFSTQPGLYGNLEGFSSSGIPVMIGDLGPIPSLRVFQQGTGNSGLPSPFPPPRPPSVPRARGGAMVIPSMRRREDQR